jgi:hypothetical protein
MKKLVSLILVLCIGATAILTGCSAPLITDDSDELGIVVPDEETNSTIVGYWVCNDTPESYYSPCIFINDDGSAVLVRSDHYTYYVEGDTIVFNDNTRDAGDREYTYELNGNTLLLSGYDNSAEYTREDDLIDMLVGSWYCQDTPEEYYSSNIVLNKDGSANLPNGDTYTYHVKEGVLYLVNFVREGRSREYDYTLNNGTLTLNGYGYTAEYSKQNY